MHGFPPTSGASDVASRDGLPWARREATSLRAWVPPSLWWAALSIPAWPAVVGPHNVVHVPLAPQLRVGGHCVGRTVFIRQSCGSYPCGKSYFPEVIL